MSWILLSFISAILLGLYEIAKKSAVKANAVPVVLLLSVTTGALVWVPLLIACAVFPDRFGEEVIHVSVRQHALLGLKSILVGASWTFAFFGLKHLPISIAIPIRATSPAWTIALAVTLMGERPDLIQWTGVMLILLAFFMFARVGRKEKIHFHRNRWIAMMVAATLLGAISALYDKYLLQSERISPLVVQVWFSIYLVPVVLPLAIRWYCVERAVAPFQWRWTIPLIALLLLSADYVYFTALAQPDALISLISPIRRASVVVAFAFGIIYLGEENWRPKAVCVAGILWGVGMLSF